MPDRTDVSLLVLTLLVVTAGCGGYGAPTATTTPPSTNASSISEGMDDPPAAGNVLDLPAGLTMTGVTDAWALAAAHRDVLADQTYTMRRQQTVRANGTLLWQATTTLQQGRGDRYVFTMDTNGTRGNVSNLTVVRTDSALVQRTTFTNGSTTYTNGANAATPSTKRYGGVYAVSQASETTVLGVVERNETTYFRLAAANPPKNTSTYADASNFTMLALVTSDGLVSEYGLSYETTRDEREVTVSTVVRFSDLGETVVNPPTWAANANVSH